MCRVVVALLVALAVLHQDFWWWNDPTPVFGFIPIGLAWHAGISLAAGLLWYLATLFCWPRILTIDPTANQPSQEPSTKD